MAYVSILMPAYNSGKYIKKAIESVLSQTFQDWELIIVDDASKDNTIAIVEEFCKKDRRIKLYKSNINSGSANLPRLKAASLAVGEFISTLDSDDYIEDEFLEKLIKKQSEINTEIVTSTMITVTSEGAEISRIPKKGFNVNILLSGKDAMENTIGEWNLSMAGGLISSDLYKSILFRSENQEMNADEINSRLLLLRAKYVGFSTAEYYCRQNFDSISRKPSIGCLSRIDTSFQLLDLVEKSFGVSRDVYFKQYVNCAIILLYTYRFVRKHRDMIGSEMREHSDKKVKYFFDYLNEKEKPTRNLPFKIKILIFDWKLFLILMKLGDLKFRFCR